MRSTLQHDGPQQIRSTRPALAGRGSSTFAPDFFIVGAPKCGTTSLDTYLAEHPAIFMAKKEQHFFGSDLADTWPQPTAEQYSASFNGGGGVALRGEASGWYLWSRCAAKEIRAYNPDARIIAMFRNPIDMLPSLHSQYVHDEMENITDFASALEAEADRREGQRVPPGHGPCPWRLFYREVVRFHEQLERYYEVFDRDRIHVVLFDDLVDDPATAYRRVLEFLGVDETFAPVFRVMNPHKRTRVPAVKHLLRAQVMNPSSLLRRTGMKLIPIHAVRSAMLRHFVPAVTRLNTSLAPRETLDRGLRATLASELEPDVERLGVLLGRDLTHWTQSAPNTKRLPSDREPLGTAGAPA